MSDLVQVNIRLPAASAFRLKHLADQAGLKVPAFIERLIANYDPASMPAPDSLTARITAIEARLDSDQTYNLIEALTAKLEGLTIKPQIQTPISEAVAELKQAGLNAQAIADELNNRGYSTNRGTPFQRNYVSKLMRSV